MELYPGNYYAKAKFLESLIDAGDFKRHASLDMIHSLVRHHDPYYKLAGNVFLGYFRENVAWDTAKAEFAYRKGLGYIDRVPEHGSYFKSLGYLQLGKLLMRKGQNTEAKEMFKLSIKFAEIKLIKDEARDLLAEI